MLYFQSALIPFPKSLGRLLQSLLDGQLKRKKVSFHETLLAGIFSCQECCFKCSTCFTTWRNKATTLEHPFEVCSGPITATFPWQPKHSITEPMACIISCIATYTGIVVHKFSIWEVYQTLHMVFKPLGKRALRRFTINDHCSFSFAVSPTCRLPTEAFFDFHNKCLCLSFSFHLRFLLVLKKYRSSPFPIASFALNCGISKRKVQHNLTQVI